MFSFKILEVMFNADEQSLLGRSRHDKLSVTVKINQSLNEFVENQNWFEVCFPGR